MGKQTPRALIAGTCSDLLEQLMMDAKRVAMTSL
jgi:hypothetical protein